MEINVKKIRKLRNYSEDFKREIVKVFESGELSVHQLEKLHGISNVCIYRWVYKYSTFNERGSRIIEMKESTQSKLAALDKKVKELERIVGQKQITIDYLEKMIELAKSDLDIDIKKNYSFPPSSGSKITGKK